MDCQQFVKSFKQLQNMDQNIDPSVQNYHKLIKMKKLLVDTQKKMFNRIKLFQKASQKVLKKKQHQMKVYQKLQSIKKDPIFSRTKLRPKTRQQTRQQYRTLQSNQRPFSRQCNQRPLSRNHNQRALSRNNNIRNIRSTQNILQHLSKNNRNSLIEDIQSPRKILAQRINQERIKNAKIMKQDKQRNKIIIDQRRKKQLTRKLQSANIIRRQRQKAKMVKQQILKQKHDDFKKFMGQKYERERQQFIKLQVHLQQLQQKQKQALITWKKTIES